MKIKRIQLQKLIENYLFEQVENKDGYYIYFAARSFNPVSAVAEYFDKFDAGHAWIMIKKPGEDMKSYSGKSGVAFETADLHATYQAFLGQLKLSQALQKSLNIGSNTKIPLQLHQTNKMIQNLVSDGELTNDDGERYETIFKRLAIGRDIKQDELISKTKDLKDQGLVTAKEYKNILKDANWGALLKLINYQPDTFEVAGKTGNYLQPIMPRKGDTQEDVKAAIEKIEKAFNNYSEDVPYDPIAGSPDSLRGSCNSNSFAYTLLRHIFSDADVNSRTNIAQVGMELPGWNLLVPGLRL